MSENDKIKSDYEYSRDTYYDLLEKGKNSLDTMIEVARESDSSSSDQVLDNAEEQILSLRDDVKRSQGPRNVKEWLGDVYSEIQIANESGSALVGISTGFKVIDELTEYLIKYYGAKGLAWMKCSEKSLEGGISKFFPKSVQDELNYHE